MLVNDTSKYYEEIKDPEERMDDEITVSHILRYRNSFTKYGLPFGTLLAKNLKEMGLLNDGSRVLEVGPGLGDLAEEFCQEAKPKEYVFVDISPKLIEFLKSRFRRKGFGFMLGNFLEMEMDKKFDLIICNEVISDFPTIVDFNPDKSKGKISEDAKRMLKDYDLKWRGMFNFNYGSIRFLEVAKKLLNKHGVVFISEQEASEWPERIRMFGHNEYTIKMDWLEQAAKKMGLSVEGGSLTQFLGIQKEKFVSFFTQPELRNLYMSLKKRGIMPEQKAQTISEFLESNKEYIKTSDLPKYKKFLEENAGLLSDVTDKFSYLIIKKLTPVYV